MKNKILRKEALSEHVCLFEINAPQIAKKYRAGQFIILRISERGERIPLTIADADPVKGNITIIFQEVGKTTAELASLDVGDVILDLIGPLGNPSEIENYGTVVCVGGGIGIAPIYPITKALHGAGNKVYSILGVRCEDLLFWEDRMRAISDKLYITTDDGSCGRKGFVTDELRDIFESGEKINRVIAIGPMVMMSAVSELTKEFKTKTIVSVDPIMVDGTGMCGACRVTVDNVMRFACVDGPEFDAHMVDFNELFHRKGFYLDEEKKSMDLYTRKCGKCRKK